MCVASLLVTSVQGQLLTPLSTSVDGSLPMPWRVVGLPNDKVPITKLEIVSLEGERVLRITSNRSYGNALHELSGDLTLKPGDTLSWRWRLDRPLPTGDLKQKAGDDTALKVCVLFDMPLDKLSLMERNLFKLARAMSKEKLPSATVCYVWDRLLPVGTELPNAYSNRLRFIVLDSGEQQLNQWRRHERDLYADFRRAFGHEAGDSATIMAVAVGADSDNTGATSLGYVGDPSLILAAPGGQIAAPVKQ